MINKMLKSLEHVPPEIIKKKLKGILWEGTPECGTLALTFDDGPDPAITPEVLDILDENNARGTFFMLGEKVKKHPGTARMVVERGHLVGNHSMTHRKMFLMKRADVDLEIDEAQKTIYDSTGVEPKWFRPPYGMFDFTTVDSIRKKGLSLVLWTVLSGDYSDDTPEEVFKTVEPFVRPGAIVVFHDTVQGGASELPGILRRIISRTHGDGISFGGVDELSVTHFTNNDEECD